MPFCEVCVCVYVFLYVTVSVCFCLCERVCVPASLCDSGLSLVQLNPLEDYLPSSYCQWDQKCKNVPVCTIRNTDHKNMSLKLESFYAASKKMFSHSFSNQLNKGSLRLHYLETVDRTKSSSRFSRLFTSSTIKSLILQEVKFCSQFD